MGWLRYFQNGTALVRPGRSSITLPTGQAPSTLPATLPFTLR